MIAEPEEDVTVPRSVRVVWTWLDRGFVPTGPRSPTTDLGPVLRGANRNQLPTLGHACQQERTRQQPQRKEWICHMPTQALLWGPNRHLPS